MATRRKPAIPAHVVCPYQPIQGMSAARCCIIAKNASAAWAGVMGLTESRRATWSASGTMSIGCSCDGAYASSCTVTSSSPRDSVSTHIGTSSTLGPNTSTKADQNKNERCAWVSRLTQLEASVLGAAVDGGTCVHVCNTRGRLEPKPTRSSSLDERDGQLGGDGGDIESLDPALPLPLSDGLSMPRLHWRAGSSPHGMYSRGGGELPRNRSSTRERFNMPPFSSRCGIGSRASLER